MDIQYNPKLIEKKWQNFWNNNESFKATKDHSKEKYYLLEMFPYPSGKIHMGHVRIYTIGDVIARFKIMSGYNVLHPMGWDAFGMPAENAAIQLKTHPSDWTYKNIEIMKKQMKRFGFSYDWSREITTCDKAYYYWEQWLFLKMFKNKIAYRKKSFVNWCNNCKTVLANEQVENDMCWRCGNNVKQKKLWQWFLKITDYAEDLLVSCDNLLDWPKKVLSMQKNWIGKNIGAEIDFYINEFKEKISVFTTRPDTIFGVTFISISHEHPLVSKIIKKNLDKKKILNFINNVSKIDDKSVCKNKEGIFTGFYCVNPVNKKKIPIYIVNFVLMNYGTGAVMSVPAHDKRDYDFAKKYNLPIEKVINSNTNINEVVFEKEGTIINSMELEGMNISNDFDKIINYLEKNKFGRKSISYRLKDWCISRQRYWGSPIPIVHCKFCGTVPVKEKDLPIVLPEKTNLLKEEIYSLKNDNSFVSVNCPNCGVSGASRETDTMDTFIESSWYFEKFCSTSNDKIFDKKDVEYWMPVDYYIGGIEHAILHLLYARYFTRILKNFGLVSYKEPFLKVLTQGMVRKSILKCDNDGFLYPIEVDLDGNKMKCKKCGSPVEKNKIEKMSKSKKNIVDPDELVTKYGADTIRLFCLFAAPPEKDLDWSDHGIEGSSKFLNRVWKLVYNWKKFLPNDITKNNIKINSLSIQYKQLLSKINKTIKKVSFDIEKKISFNTAISSMMELVNMVSLFKHNKIEKINYSEKIVLRTSIETIILLLSPMAPHFCEELWNNIGNKKSLLTHSWPKYNENLFYNNKITFVIQVNGKVRDKIEVDQNIKKEMATKLALTREKIVKHLKNKKIENLILIKNKLINIVTS